jgi:hypothetical protein
MEMIGKVRRIKLGDKLSNRAIAKLTGLSRNTIKKRIKAPGDFPQNAVGPVPLAISQPSR